MVRPVERINQKPKMSTNQTWHPCPKTSAQAVDDASCQQLEQPSTGANQAGAAGE